MTIKKWLVQMEDTTVVGPFDSQEAYNGFCEQHGYQTIKHTIVDENENIKEEKTTRKDWIFKKSNSIPDNPNHGVWLRV